MSLFDEIETLIPFTLINDASFPKCSVETRSIGRYLSVNLPKFKTHYKQIVQILVNTLSMCC